MKKLFLILIPVLFFVSCYREPPMHSIATSIDLNENVINCKTTYDAWLEVRNTEIITGHYFLIPLSDESFTINKLYSTDPDVIEVLSIDTDNCTFSAAIKKIGKAKIKIESDNYPVGTSLRIEVKSLSSE